MNSIINFFANAPSESGNLPIPIRLYRIYLFINLFMVIMQYPHLFCLRSNFLFHIRKKEGWNDMESE